MRDVIWPALALVMALLAVILASITGPLALGVAIATLGVAFAVVYQYLYAPGTKEEEIRVEDFSWWADLGEPLFRLKEASPNDEPAAAQLIASDLKVIHKNCSLLHDRISLLVGRRGFEDLPATLLVTETQQVAGAMQKLVEECEKSLRLRPDLYKTLERMASRLDRVGNKLYEFERGKSETIIAYVDPLRRAAEKLSKDLRKAASHLFQYEKRIRGP